MMGENRNWPEIERRSPILNQITMEPRRADVRKPHKENTRNVLIINAPVCGTNDGALTDYHADGASTNAWDDLRRNIIG